MAKVSSRAKKVLAIALAITCASIAVSGVFLRSGYADDVERDLAPGSSIGGNLSGAGKKDYYKVEVNSGTKLKIILDGPSTSGVDFDLYIKKNAKPTTSSYDARAYTNSADETLTVNNPSGIYYVMVYAYKGSGSYTITATVEGGSQNDEYPSLAPGTPYTGYASAGSKQYFTVDVPRSGTALTVILSGPNNADFDLYLKGGSAPTTSSYDARGYTNTAQEKVVLNANTNPQLVPGKYFVMVHAYSGNGQFTLTAIVEIAGSHESNVTEIQAGGSITETIAQNESRYFKSTVIFVVPGFVKISLTGPGNADLDLYVKIDGIPTKADYTYRSTGAGSTEIVYCSGGHMYMMVYAYSGGGEFTISVTPGEGVAKVENQTVFAVPAGTTAGGRIGTVNEKVYFQTTIYFFQPGNLTIKLQGPSGTDFDLYVKAGSLPSTTKYDYRSVSSTSTETIQITNAGGTYYILVYSYRGTGAFTLTVTAGN
ncbi:MAG: PPC domain-containing protein [Thermoplasmata archaeon]|nr:PPC domain-containing protein [Thermoplasmata archaeon]